MDTANLPVTEAEINKLISLAWWAISPPFAPNEEIRNLLDKLLDFRKLFPQDKEGEPINQSDAAVASAFQSACNDFRIALRNGQDGEVYLKAANAIEDAYPAIIEEYRKRMAPDDAASPRRSEQPAKPLEE